MTVQFDILSATEADINAIAHIHRDARQVAMPWLPDIHTPEEDRWFFENIVLKQDTLLVARVKGRVLGFMGTKEDWLNHLYVRPERWRCGVGTHLLKAAQEANSYLQLWSFQRNTAARRFYAAHGFRECELTDGQGNEEKAPDVRMEWRR